MNVKSSTHALKNNGIETHDACLVSLVVPVYNEQDSIAAFVEKIGAELGHLTPSVDFEIVFVNDGSSDATEFAVRSVMQKDKRIALVNLSRNFGKDSALCAGLEHCSGDAVIPIDVDLQDSPEVIPEMIQKWRAGAKVVNARRIDRSNDSWAKQISASAFDLPPETSLTLM